MPIDQTLYIQQQPDGRFVWCAQFFVWDGSLGHWTWKRTGGFTATNLEALSESDRFLSEVSE